MEAKIVLCDSSSWNYSLYALCRRK